MSSEEEEVGGRIGFRPTVTGGPKGVVFKNSSKDPARAAGIGARFRTATAAPAPAPAKKVTAAPAPRQITMATAPKKMELPVVTAAPAPAEAEGKKGVRFAEEAEVKIIDSKEPVAAVTATEAAGGAGEESKEEVVAPPADKSAILATGTVDAASVATPAAALALKKQVKGIDVSRVGPPPADSPMVTASSFAKDVMPMLTYLKETKPVEITPTNTVEIKGAEGDKGFLAAGPVYTPITSPEFPYFMIQTYQQYSKALSSLVMDAATGKPVVAAKEIDKDACKKFDPNKVENFYYQKLVRDYISYGTPYRGNLLYHGLGSGKTCTSIAAAEALYWGGQRKIYVMTPATLSNNYRRELAKCGYFPLRRSNHWTFLPVTPGDKGAQRNTLILTEMLGLPAELVEKQGGGWLPNPTAPSNWERLTPAQQESIRQQQTVHMNARFRFIHYNGVSPATLAQLAEVGLKDNAFEFDNAVIIIDEVHNLVRTINGTRLGGRSVAEIMDSGIEPREFTWSMPLRRERPGYRYPRGYTLYRLLQGAVNSKVICMSATPMINYAQELAVLVNILGGEQRVVEIPLAGLRKDLTAEERAGIQAENEAAKGRAATVAEMESRRAGKPVAAQPARQSAMDVPAAIELWAKYHPEIDFYAIEEAADRTPVLRVTTVPHGFAKVADSDYPMRGFVRMKNAMIPAVSKSRERNMDLWGASLVQEMEDRGFFTKKGVGAEAVAAVQTARATGVGTVPATKTFRTLTFPMLPENGDVFVPNFVDRATLKIINREVLVARCSGLVSYYKGGSEELMPRMSRNEVVEVPMSDYMFKEYTRARMKEMEMEGELPAAEGEGAAGAKKRKGATAAEQDLYAQATKTQSAGFKSLTRAACNWVFPEEIPRPVFSKQDQLRALGLDTRDQLIAADLAEDTDVEQAPSVGGAAVGGGGATPSGAPGEAETPGPAVLADEPTAEAEVPLETSLAGKITAALEALEAKSDTYLDKEIATFSPKYAAILANIRTSPGPVLVYSQFKTLEGLGIFAAALRASPEGYLPLDIVMGSDGQWTIPDEFMEVGVPRYILYTGDQPLDKRRLLLQLYNADVASLPPKLSAQCAALLDGAPDNRDGRVARVFMITQSGAEGISLFNTRQVHIMEPYWNNVRLQQVIGRAIRTCSHMNLPWEDREVAVFTYLSVFTDKQKAEGARQVIMADKGMTTDQTIFDIATKKQKLADELAAILQEAAVDCDIHRYENGITGNCFRFSKGSRPNFLWHPDWKRDLQLSSMMRKKA